jgi:hypothetical protein
MSQKSDDSIERFFRKAVVQQDKAFMERDWQSLERMLDAQAVTVAAQHAAKVRTLVRTVAFAIIVASLFIIGAETQTHPDTVQMQAAVGMVGPRTQVKKENPAADLHSFDVPCDNSKNEQASVKVASVTDEGLITAHHTKLLTPQITPGNESSSQQTFQSAESALVSNQSKNKLLINQRPAKRENPLDGTSAILDLAAENTMQSTNSGTGVLSEVNTDSIAKAEDNIVEKLVEDLEEEEEQEQSLRVPRVIITALVSPDFSTTSLSRYSKPSGVFGVLLGYRISKRFTVMTGVTKSLKKYEGYGEEYTPPAGYWQNRTNGVVPDEVEGNCGIVEIPLMVQFDILQRSKSRFFISSGISSYFMRSENYQYKFNEPNPGAANSWTAKKPTQYLFKIGHLSAGYDRFIGKNFSIGIEPFLKIPFEGIGWTDINLYSTGAYINLRYMILQTH